MQERSVTHDTFVIERSYPATPERVFAALADAGKKRRWFAEGEGHEVEGFEMDFRLGGKEHARFRLSRGPFQGMALTTDGTYLDIVPDRRVVIAATLALGGRCISATLATFELLAGDRGTDLVFTHQAAFFEGADGPELRQAGWRKLLDRLAEELADKV
jgi:uncharacterized protein YndB with AHSA1/START domain